MFDPDHLVTQGVKLLREMDKPHDVILQMCLYHQLPCLERVVNQLSYFFFRPSQGPSLDKYNRNKMNPIIEKISIVTS